MLIMPLKKGIVAIANQNALGKWVISCYQHGEYEESKFSSLPAGAEETEDGRYYIPLDNTPVYMNGGKNAQYGKPLPPQQMRRSGVFYGSIGTGEMKPYFFSYKNQGGVDFAPNTFEWVHFLCVANDAGTDIYGAKDLTVNSLSLNSEMSPIMNYLEICLTLTLEHCLMNNFGSHLTPLMELDRAGYSKTGIAFSKERYVITDGTVTNMNMTPTKNGNRIINITDIDYELDYSDVWNRDRWIPVQHLTLDFRYSIISYYCWPNKPKNNR